MNNIPDSLILLPHLEIENANAISSPLTWGFPSPSAFTGFVHALHRKMGTEEISLNGVGIVCHRFAPQVYKPKGKYEYRFNLARHPVGQDGKPPGTIEEGRVHLEVSLVVGIYGEFEGEQEGEDFAKRLYHEAFSMRLAGGSLRPGPTSRRHTPIYMELSGTLSGEERAFRKWRRKLLPGFALVSRRDLLHEHLAELRQKEPKINALEALLDLIRINVEPNADDGEDLEKVDWHASRSRPGWLVPLPIGYHAISPLYGPGEVNNTRDDITPFRFVECLYSLGEWLSPHRINHPKEMLWYHRPDPDKGLYLFENHPTSS